MVRGWVEHPGGRHHGAHGAEAARALGVPAEALLDFSQNINPLGPPPGALEAARKAIFDEAGRYPDAAYRRLREAMGEYLNVDPELILPTNGGAEALFLAARAAATGEKALVLEPTFSEYATAALAAGLEPARLVIRRLEDGFRPDLGTTEELAESSALVFLCNPNNPTGEALSRADVLALADRVRENGGVLVVDEAFADFAPGESVVADAGDALYVARSFTKFFAIPGLRLGCLVCGDPHRLQRFQPSWSVNAAAAAAGVAAVRDAAFAQTSVDRTRELREALFAKLAELPGLTPFAGAANFLFARGPEGLATRLAARGVLVRGCEPFMGLGPGYFRVAVRRFEENERLVTVLREEL